MTLPYEWHPSGTTSLYGAPQAGQFVAYEHAVWRVIEVNPVPAELWTDAQRARLAGSSRRPVVAVLRPASITGDDPRDRDRDIHLGDHGTACWEVYRHEHYPVCATCSEPMPCREAMAERESKKAGAYMSRYEVAGVCPHCGKPVSKRQKSRTFPENVEFPGGPPVTFHIGRYGCRRSAADYERRWIAADPAHGRPALSCEGHVTTHNDGTYECTQMAGCPSPEAEHRSYTTCRCPECHAAGSFGCHPGPNARLVVGGAEIQGAAR